jgi:hypothetical protein
VAPSNPFVQVPSTEVSGMFGWSCVDAPTLQLKPRRQSSEISIELPERPPALGRRRHRGHRLVFRKMSAKGRIRPRPAPYATSIRI